jgi:hypothetical protein
MSARNTKTSRKVTSKPAAAAKSPTIPKPALWDTPLAAADAKRHIDGAAIRRGREREALAAEGIISSAGLIAIASHRQEVAPVCLGPGRELLIFKLYTTVSSSSQDGSEEPVDVVAIPAVASQPGAFERAARELLALAKRFDPAAQSAELTHNYFERDDADVCRRAKGGAR